jgi:hypothetical protein
VKLLLELRAELARYIFGDLMWQIRVGKQT